MQRTAHAVPVSDTRGHASARLSIRLLIAMSAALVACMAWTAAASAAAPASDAFEAAAPVSDLPFSDSVHLTEATIQAGEPQFCLPADKTAWYAVTPPRDGPLAASTSSPTAMSQVTAYSSDGSGIGGLAFLSCQNYALSKAVFAVQAGENYYIQVSTVFRTSGPVRPDVDEQRPPANDDFADATPVSSVPYSDTVDMTAASVEEGEA